MTDAIVMKAIEADRLVFPFGEEMDQLKAKNNLLSDEAERLAELESTKAEFDRHDLAYHNSITNGRLPDAEKHAKSALDVLKRVR